MRAIKFRGKDEKTREWVYGYYSRKMSVINDKVVVDHYICAEAGEENIKVLASTVGQCTFFTAGDGKEIFEGDILEYHHPYKNQKIPYKVDWCKYGFYMTAIGDIDSRGLSTFKCDCCRIIGNIHDNKELLKK